MKIIHCADLHLGSSLTTHFDSKHAKERKAELFNTFLNMLEYAHNHDVQGIIIAGDLFDKDNRISKIKKETFKAIENYPDLQVYYLKGNHDTKVEIETVPDNLHFFDREWKCYCIGESNTVKIYGTELSKSSSGYIYNTLNLNRNDFNIVTLHGQESKYDSKEDAEIINLSALKNRGIDYLALGHIHSYKVAQLDARGKYCYSGCLEGRGFDESGKHGFVLLDIDEKTHKYTTELIPIAKREIFHEEVEISHVESSTEAGRIVKKHMHELNLPESSYGEVILTGELDLDTEIDETIIQKELEDEFYYIKVKNNTERYIDYSLYEMDESLKGEFIRIVHEQKDLDEKEMGDIIQLGISALKGEL